MTEDTQEMTFLDLNPSFLVVTDFGNIAWPSCFPMASCGPNHFDKRGSDDKHHAITSATGTSNVILSCGPEEFDWLEVWAAVWCPGRHGDMTFSWRRAEWRAQLIMQSLEMELTLPRARLCLFHQEIAALVSIALSQRLLKFFSKAIEVDQYCGMVITIAENYHAGVFVEEGLASIWWRKKSVHK